MIGSAIAIDLTSRHQVTAFDLSNANLELLKNKSPEVEIQQADLRDYPSYPKLFLHTAGAPQYSSSSGYKVLVEQNNQPARGIATMSCQAFLFLK